MCKLPSCKFSWIAEENEWKKWVKKLHQKQLESCLENERFHGKLLFFPSCSSWLHLCSTTQPAFEQSCYHEYMEDIFGLACYLRIRRSGFCSSQSYSLLLYQFCLGRKNKLGRLNIHEQLRQPAEKKIQWKKPMPSLEHSDLRITRYAEMLLICCWKN